jgi:cell division protease FtsH
VDTLDAAVRRPGRFDRTVAVDRPDRKGREDILGVHVRSKKVPLADDVSIADVAKDTAGFTGAELANVVNEAALLAARRDVNVVDAAAFESAIMRASLGIERKRSLLQGSEKTAVARHEAGHAIVGAAVSSLLPAGGYRTESISLSSRSNGVLGSLGNTKMAQTGDDRTMYFADEFRGQLAMMLGGRAAEELSASGRVSTGAADDIQRATKLSYTAVAEWGFSAAVGPMAVPTLTAGSGDMFGRESGGAAAAAVEAEVSALLKGALEAARAVLVANAALLDRLGATLEADEKVAGARLAAFLEQATVPQALRDFVTAPQIDALRLLPKPDEPRT